MMANRKAIAPSAFSPADRLWSHAIGLPVLLPRQRVHGAELNEPSLEPFQSGGERQRLVLVKRVHALDDLEPCAVGDLPTTTDELREPLLDLRSLHLERRRTGHHIP